jgi:FkbM family methyltransferase
VFKAVTFVSNYLRTKPALGRIALAMVPDIPWTAQFKPVGPFRIRLRRHRAFWLRGLYHEPFVLGCFARLTRRGDVFYDVGSNIGLYVRLLSSHLGVKQVIGFEPMTENREILLRNVELGKLDGVTIFPYALSDRNYQEQLQIDDCMSGSAALNSVTEGKAAVGRQLYGLGPKTEPVQVKTLDSLIEEEHLPPPNLIKIDIEGAEGRMLRGARGTLLKHHPRLIVECHGIAASQEVFESLDSAGYTCACELGHGDGKVEYTVLNRRHVENLKTPWDMHMVLASANPDDVREPVKSVDAITLASRAVSAKSASPSLSASGLALVFGSAFASASASAFASALDSVALPWFS